MKQVTLDLDYNRAEKKRLALQRVLDSIPAQIDSINEKRECDAIELRKFMMGREADEMTRLRNSARRKTVAIGTSASP